MSLSMKDNRFNGDAVTLQKLDKVVQVHKVLEKRNIKEVNYEFNIQGKEKLNTVSAAIVLQKLWSMKKSNTV